MLYLLLAILSSSLISIIMRLSSGRAKSERGMLLANYAVCSLIAALYSGPKTLFAGGEGFGFALGLGVFGGFLFLTAFILFQRSVKKNGVVLSSSFMKLGLLVPIVLSVTAFHEKPSLWEALGFLLALAAIVLINYRPQSGKSGFTFSLPILLLVGGMADSMTKVFEELGNSAFSSAFLFCIFASAFIMCSLLIAYEKKPPAIKDLLYGAAVGIPNYFSSHFLLMALESGLSGVVAYPVFSVFTILIVSVAGVLVFREKLEKRQWAGIAIILVSLALLNAGG